GHVKTRHFNPVKPDEWMNEAAKDADRYYSIRSACTGSNREALNAGMRHAAIATPSSRTATPTNTLASVGCTPYNKLRIRLPAAKPPASPNARPKIAGRIPSASVS